MCGWDSGWEWGGLMRGEISSEVDVIWSGVWWG